MPETFIRGKIVRIVDEQRIVINVGLEHGVHPGDKFHILEMGEELSDPETGQSLGVLELVKGVMEALHVQEKLSLLMTVLNPDRTTSPSTSVLSATLAQTSSGGRPQMDPSRLSLRVRPDQVRGYSLSAPVALGDPVRSVEPNISDS